VTVLALAFGLLDATFVVAGLPKFIDGAWVPLVIAGAISLVGVTWLTGRRAMASALHALHDPIPKFTAQYGPLAEAPKGTVVILSADPTGVPFVTTHKWLDKLITDEAVVLLTVIPKPRPYIPEAQRVDVERVSERLVKVSACFGYMETPRIMPIIRACGVANLDIDKDTTSFVYAAPVIIHKEHGLPRWQRQLFQLLWELSRTLAEDLEIKANRRIQLGVEVAV
jgi:KUP system potassium uptake protein